MNAPSLAATVAPAVDLVEVGPRDGLQNEAARLDPAVRADFALRLEAAGVRRMETASFVHPAYVPQMAGAEDVVAAMPPAPGRSRIGLVLNTRGYRRAAATAVDEINVSIAMTDGFGLRNQGLDRAGQAAMLDEIMALRTQTGDRRPISVTVSCVWGCPFDGDVDAGAVGDLVGRLAALKADEIALADTIGAGDPWTVRTKVRAALASAGDTPLRLHFHDTRNTAMANAFSGLEAGASVLDASVGGVGGCPFAPGATGNVATEDLAWMLERAGIRTGLDVDALIAAARWIGDRIGRPASSALSRAGPYPG